MKRILISAALLSLISVNVFAQEMSNLNLIGRWECGPCYTCFIDGNYAFIGNGRAMDTVNISNPNSPVKVGRVMTPGTVRGIYTAGNYAYVADEERGLRIINI